MSIIGEHLATCPIGSVDWADCCCGDALAEAGDGERFYEIRARFYTLEGALEWAHTLDASGVVYVAVDTGEGYGLRECAVNGCTAILAYPDEGDRCEDHSA